MNQGPWPPTPTKLPSGSQKLLSAICLRRLDLCATLVLQPVTHEAEELLIQPKWEKNGKYHQQKKEGELYNFKWSNRGDLLTRLHEEVTHDPVWRKTIPEDLPVKLPQSVGSWYVWEKLRNPVQLPRWLKGRVVEKEIQKVMVVHNTLDSLMVP